MDISLSFFRNGRISSERAVISSPNVVWIFLFLKWFIYCFSPPINLLDEIGAQSPCHWLCLRQDEKLLNCFPIETTDVAGMCRGCGNVAAQEEATGLSYGRSFDLRVGMLFALPAVEANCLSRGAEVYSP